MSTKLAKIIADFNTSLATKVSIAGTTATLQSATDDDGVALPSGRYFFTVDGNNSSKEHFSCDLSGTALTNLKSISRQGVETAGAVRAHRVGATVIITNFAHLKFINDLLDGTTDLDGSNPLKYDADPTLTDDAHIATKKYVDDTAFGGSVTLQSLVASGTAGETVVSGNLVYFDLTDNEWKKTDADTASTVQGVMLGIAQGSGVDGGSISGGVLLSGLDSTQTGMTQGDLMYASNTAGGISSSAGTTPKVVGIAASSTSLYFNPVFYDTISTNEKDALAGGSTFGTPSSSNKFITQDYNSSATGLPVTRVYSTAATKIGGPTSQFDITNPSGTTFRYTWDTTGTDPVISAATMPVGSFVDIIETGFHSTNRGSFIVTGSGTNYFEVTNASGTVESDKIIGTGGHLAIQNLQWTKPSGLKYITVEMVGGGAGGGGVDNSPVVNNGGGAGGYSKEIIPVASLGSTVSYMVGVSGTGGPGSGATASNGFAGGTSAFGDFLKATGGLNNGSAGTGTGGDINFDGQGGQGGEQESGNDNNGGYGGSSWFGYGGRGASDNSGGIGSTGGQGGGGYGSGGGGAAYGGSSDADGGNGAAGIIILTEYYS